MQPSILSNRKVIIYIYPLNCPRRRIFKHTNAVMCKFSYEIYLLLKYLWLANMWFQLTNYDVIDFNILCFIFVSATKWTFLLWKYRKMLVFWYFTTDIFLIYNLSFCKITFCSQFQSQLIATYNKHLTCTNMK